MTLSHLFKEDRWALPLSMPLFSRWSMLWWGLSSPATSVCMFVCTCAHVCVCVFACVCRLGGRGGEWREVSQMLPVPPLLSLWCHPSVEHSHALSVKSLEGHTLSGWCFLLLSSCTHWPANQMWCSNFKPPLQHHTTQNGFQNFIRAEQNSYTSLWEKRKKEKNRKRGARQVDREKKRQPEREREETQRDPVNIPDLICFWFRLAQTCWPEMGEMILAHLLACSQNLTQSTRTKSDPGWFCTTWSGTFMEEHNRAWKWETSSRPAVFCQKPATMVPAHQLASIPDAFVWPNPDHAMLIGSGLVLHNMIHAFGKMEPNQMLEVGSDIYDLARF